MFSSSLLILAETAANAFFILILFFGLPLFIRWCCLIGSVLLEKWQTRQEEKLLARRLKVVRVGSAHGQFSGYDFNHKAFENYLNALKGLNND